MAKIYQYKKSFGLPLSPSSSGFTSSIPDVGDEGYSSHSTSSSGFTSTIQDVGDDGYSSHNFSSSDYEKEVELEVTAGRGDFSTLEYTGSMRVSLDLALQLNIHFMYGTLWWPYPQSLFTLPQKWREKKYKLNIPKKNAC